MVLDVFALIVLGVVIAAVIWLVVLLGTMPENVACRHGHLQTAAIRVLGWIGIVTLGPAWLAALVWAYTKPGGTAGVSKRVTAPEEELQKLRGAQGGDAS